MAYLMIVDDDEDLATAAAMALSSVGHEVQIESMLPTALDHMQARPPDLVILDVMFPEDTSGGFKLARAMKRSGKKLREVPVLILSAINALSPIDLGGDADLDSGQFLGSDYLEKPFDLDVLQSKVAGMLAS